MKRSYSVLKQIQGKHNITKESDPEFLYNLQIGLLLALKEQGLLNEIQFEYAQKKVHQRCGGSKKP